MRLQRGKGVRRHRKHASGGVKNAGRHRQKRPRGVDEDARFAALKMRLRCRRERAFDGVENTCSTSNMRVGNSRKRALNTENARSKPSQTRARRRQKRAFSIIENAFDVTENARVRREKKMHSTLSKTHVRREKRAFDAVENVRQRRQKNPAFDVEKGFNFN